MKMPEPKSQTTNMSVTDILEWIESHEANPELTTICPANFFTSVRHWLTVSGPDIWSLAAERDEMLEALKGVVRVADRKTDEFDAARATIAKGESHA